VKEGSPSLTSASTKIGQTSIPWMAADNTRANIIPPYPAENRTDLKFSACTNGKNKQKKSQIFLKKRSDQSN
jgi:hypothetical protein